MGKFTILSIASGSIYTKLCCYWVPPIITAARAVEYTIAALERVCNLCTHMDKSCPCYYGAGLNHIDKFYTLLNKPCFYL